MNIPEEVLELAALAVFGVRGRDWTIMERLACEGQAKRALTAASGHFHNKTIESVAELELLLIESVIRTRQGYAMEKLSDGWRRAGVDYAYTPNASWLPAVVLYEPEAL